MEVEAVDEGEVLEILVAEGTEGVKVNTPIARLAGDDVAPAPKKVETAPDAEAKKEAPKAEAPKTEAPKAAPAPVAASGERIFASPLARRLAAMAGLDLKAIKGTGPHGRIVKRDVEAAQ